MLILSLDTSGRTASVALCRDGEIIGYIQKDADLKHSRTILPLCRLLMEEQKIELEQVDLFAATVGPGSFTGIRIGVSAVKGLAWASQKPCVAVSSLVSAAWAGGKRREPVCALILARPEEYYYAVYRWDGDLIRPLWEERAEDWQSILKKLKDLSEPVRLCGSGAMEFYQMSSWGEPAGQNVENAKSAALCAWSMAQRGLSVNCHRLTPAYLKPCQAERMRKDQKG